MFSGNFLELIISSTIFFKTIGISLLTFYVIQWYLNKPANLPPGSAGIPVLGYMPFLSRNVHKDLARLAKEKFGNLYHIYLGSSLTIVLNDFSIIKEALVKNGEAFSGRPDDANFDDDNGQNLGVIMTNGDYWKQHRRFILSRLRDYGVGKLALEPLLLDEIHHFIKTLDGRCDKALKIKDLLNLSMSNNIHLLVTGQRFEYDHPTFKKVLQMFKDFTELISLTNLETFFPWISYVPGNELLLKRKIRRKIFQSFLNVVTESINLVKHKYKDGESETFIQAYLTEKSKRTKADQNQNIFTESGLLHTSRDLLAAGTDTSASTVLWILLYMTNYPEIQKKVQMELDEVIGRERDPSYNDRLQTPYTEAVICEVHRIVSLAPLNFRQTIRQTKLRGYTIPSKTMIISNVWAVHNDPKLWGDPENFRPERFITSEGKLVKPDYLIPFALGKRMCIGEPLARMEIYLYFASLLQNFDFLPVDGVMPSLEYKPNFLLYPTAAIIFPKRR